MATPTLLFALSLSLPAHAPVELDRIEVVGRAPPRQGVAISASEGEVSGAEIMSRPIARVGDLLEFVPGLIATQHSGSGKANQYFLRGFNLDHGTDFASFVDGMPVNLRSHGHGQGYTDLNFVIPELIASIGYRKGVYHADVGDFASAGSARLELRDRLEGNETSLTVGEYGHLRGLALFGGSPAEGSDLYVAVEGQTHDGAWRDVDEDVRKRNAVLRFSHEGERGHGHLTLMLYRNRWNSPDQIPQRAVADGSIDRLGSIDTTLGGDSGRDSLSAGWSGEFASGALHARAYLVSYDLKLWSNFTYFLDDPERGDQFLQFDDRRYGGGELTQTWQQGRHLFQVGLDYRLDDIDDVGLSRTRARVPLSPVRRDQVRQWSLGSHVTVESAWTERVRSSLGLRGDLHRFRVDADLPENGGRRRDQAVSPKFGVSFALDPALELYASAGRGLHSNDARGTTIRIDPLSGESVDAVDPLVASRGGELGARYTAERWHGTLALWRLDLDSEQLFVGDAGTTEASRASRREGLELGLYAYFGDRLSADLEFAVTRSRFRDDDPAGSRIPGAIPRVGGLTLRYEGDRDVYAQLRWRHFSGYPLIEDGGVESDGSDLVHFRVGRRFGDLDVALDVYNLLDSRDHDIDYFYASRLPGEPEEGVEDVHFRAFEPRSLRLSMSYLWH